MTPLEDRKQTELLRKEMIDSFKVYASAHGKFREGLWQNYVLLREGYMRQSSGDKYLPLKPVLIAEEIPEGRRFNQLTRIHDVTSN